MFLCYTCVADIARETSYKVLTRISVIVEHVSWWMPRSKFKRHDLYDLGAVKICFIINHLQSVSARTHSKCKTPHFSPPSIPTFINRPLLFFAFVFIGLCLLLCHSRVSKGTLATFSWTLCSAIYTLFASQRIPVVCCTNHIPWNSKNPDAWTQPLTFFDSSFLLAVPRTIFVIPFVFLFIRFWRELLLARIYRALYIFT